MKKRFSILIAIAAFATTLTTNALGQTSKTVKASVTFDFYVGEHTFPAGEYRIDLLSDNILQIRSVRGPSKNKIIVANHSNGQKQTPKLIFRKNGEDHFLTRIFLDTDQGGYSISPSRRQRESAKFGSSLHSKQLMSIGQIRRR